MIQDFDSRIQENFIGCVVCIGLEYDDSLIEVIESKPYLRYVFLFNSTYEISPTPNKKIIFIDGVDFKEAFKEYFTILQLETVRILNYSFEEEDIKLKEDIFNYINSITINGVTTAIRGEDFFKNRFRNIYRVKYLFESLRDKYKDIPCVLVAGGPSLDKNIHELRDFKGLIISVDTALPTLLKNGIRPHFISSIDPNNITYEKIADHVGDLDGINLITSGWVCNQVTKSFSPKNTFPTFMNKPVEVWMNKYLGGEILTSGCNSVAELNMTAAYILGCDPIIIIGQDLCYKEKESSHSEDVVIKNKPTTSDAFDIKTIKGEDAHISNVFLNIKNHFELMASKMDGTLINATYDGVNIEGFENMSLKDAIEKYPTINTRMLIKLEEIDTKPLEEEFRNTINKCNQLIKKIDKSIKFLDKKQLDKYNELTKEIDSDIIWQILNEISISDIYENEKAIYEIDMESDPEEKYKKQVERVKFVNNRRKEILGILKKEIFDYFDFKKKEKTPSFYLDNGYYLEALNLLQGKEKYTVHDRFLYGCICLGMGEIEESKLHFNCVPSKYNKRIQGFKDKLISQYQEHITYLNKIDPESNTIEYFNNKIKEING